MLVVCLLAWSVLCLVDKRVESAAMLSCRDIEVVVDADQSTHFLTVSTSQFSMLC